MRVELSIERFGPIVRIRRRRHLVLGIWHWSSPYVLLLGMDGARTLVRIVLRTSIKLNVIFAEIRKYQTILLAFSSSSFDRGIPIQ